MAYNTPPVSFSESDPNVNFGQIRDLLLGTVGQPLADMTWPTIELRLDNAAVAADTVLRRMSVLAQKAAPERASVDLSHLRKAYGVINHSITGYVDDTNDTNYDFLVAQADKPAAEIAVWYATESHVYGGVDGIAATMNINHIIPESSDEVERFEFTIEWKGSNPTRDANPLPVANND